MPKIPQPSKVKDLDEGSLVFSAFSAFPVIKMLFPRVFGLLVAPFPPHVLTPLDPEGNLHWLQLLSAKPLPSTSQRKSISKSTEVERCLCWHRKKVVHIS